MSESALPQVDRLETLAPSGDGAVLALSEARSLYTYLFLKRILDITVAFAGLVLCLPLWVVIAAAIKLDSPGAVFFSQRRPGSRGRFFRMLKFRTMRADAEEHLDDVIHLNEQEDGTLIRIPNDPRVTRVGRFLRHTSLDETPQLINVLRGEMSLVGPRPISRPIQDVRGRLRLYALPGITGLWQINGRKATDTDHMLEQDMKYLRQRCMWLDLHILLKTVPAVIGGKGAA